MIVISNMDYGRVRPRSPSRHDDHDHHRVGRDSTPYKRHEAPRERGSRERPSSSSSSSTHKHPPSPSTSSAVATPSQGSQPQELFGTRDVNAYYKKEKQIGQGAYAFVSGSSSFFVNVSSCFFMLSFHM